ncbi:bacterioferritin [Allopseudospirillum japonicum]|uniref:Bacterioferritin n=1 Tax=Allopseudospirillum japonicum TaxID=64971 RepID=A0A1H6U2D5_9GAMM|nr:bacterioferritin [Allopseudospirillum japonicum]SEI83707.1 bacterioferritin [Allopseudospirillum japonicum]
MKLDPKINACLNGVLKGQLTAINQYFLHARMQANWGLENLEKPIYKASIRAMKDADTLIERLLLLEGLPNLQALGKLLIAETPVEALKNDLQLELQLRQDLVTAIADVESLQDFQTREHLEHILHHSEEHIDWLETQLSLLADIGEQNYLQSQI